MHIWTGISHAIRAGKTEGRESQAPTNIFVDISSYHREYIQILHCRGIMPASALAQRVPECPVVVNESEHGQMEVVDVPRIRLIKTEMPAQRLIVRDGTLIS